ncbi:MAG: hypothetical protein GIW95_10215 [Candidatus Eremiobacteraeota bacterium]|nr:hypothetical protein [Candidatus Eremiobacteraeota bacterium]
MKNEATIDGITVAGQLTDEELAGLKNGDFKTIVNVRMPEELDEPERPKIPSELSYHEIGFTGATLSREHVGAVRAALDASEGKALIH